MRTSNCSIHGARVGDTRARRYSDRRQFVPGRADFTLTRGGTQNDKDTTRQQVLVDWYRKRADLAPWTGNPSRPGTSWNQHGDIGCSDVVAALGKLRSPSPVGLSQRVLLREVAIMPP
jgi:hypothetical protein